MDKTVIKALSLLDTLSQTGQPRGVTELAIEVGLTKANVHRLLRTLLEAGYVVQNPADSRYALSMKLWEMGARNLRSIGLLDVARDVVRALCATVDESVQLGVPDAGGIVYVDKADSSHPLRATTEIGSRVPSHCVSCGKATLAFSSHLAEQLRFPLSRHTDQTITDADAMARELSAIQAAGYAVNRGEWRPGIWGIAAPIFGAHGDVVASIGAWGPEQRFSGDAVLRLGAQVKVAASRISAGLGHGVAAVKA